MKAKKEITLFEFGFVAKDDRAEVHSRVQKVSASSYDYLKRMCLGDESDRKLLKLRSLDGMEVLQVQNYAGVIFTPDKTQIEVLPKIGKSTNEGEGEEQARVSLLTMLRALKGFSHIQTASANITHQKMPLLEVFIGQFLHSVNALVKRGLRSDYVRREDNLAYLKGKLNVGKQLRHNFINKHKFYCEYDEFLLDRPANRLIHSALLNVKSLARSVANQKLAQELAFVFHEVPKSHDHKSDFSKVKSGRGMNHYDVPLQWCQLILNGYSPQTMKGDHHAISLLFPMEKVFEDYVAKIIKAELAQSHPTLQLETQATGEHLARYQQKGKFSLRPDLLIKHDKRNVAVLDTKWKLLDSKISNANLSQSDIYQMFAYAKKYLKRNADEQHGNDVVLIYPMQANFTQPLPTFFDLDEGHKLWITPFEINGDKSKWHKPETLVFSIGSIIS
ncbi:McrC family protein [Aliivibrio fischeri]|uniref:McrC family protein n=1 Tax=Aliivibrio fischeri TaxID=668 RepID=UPI00080DCD7F|nr:McrC family protein [Aliivibrio fischeri]OCH40712.1 restriction endonuclease [Aliivibrio fischeri]